MIEEKLTVGLVVERRRIDSEWADTQSAPFAWRPSAVFLVPPDVVPWTALGSASGSTRYYAGAYDIALYSTETTNYRDNLLADDPKLWVVLNASSAEPPITITAVTADPAEGEAHTEAGSNTVETISMPHDIATEIAGFVADHHVERPILKRKRDRAEPDVRWRPGEGPSKGDRPSQRQGEHQGVRPKDGITGGPSNMTSGAGPDGKRGDRS